MSGDTPKPVIFLAFANERAPRNMTRVEWGQFMKHEPSYRATCPDLPVEEEE